MEKELVIIEVGREKKETKERIDREAQRRRKQRLKRKRLEAKRRRRKHFLQAVCFCALGICLLTAGKKFFSMNKAAESTFGISVQDVEFESFFQENMPKQRSDEEIYAQLKKLAEEYPELREIYEKRLEYPVRMLGSLCNNPEMYEFVEDYLAYISGDHSVSKKAKLTTEEKKQKYPLFLQWDKRWGYQAYGDFNIALSGCGPTALAMAAVALTGDDTVTPDKVAEYSMKNGYYVEGTGTAWSLMTDGCKHFGITSEEIALDESVMKNQLDDGKVLICSMREGDFTAVGHFIMIYGYNAEGFFVNDPNCIYRSSRTWPYETLKNQIRILWAFKDL